MPTSTRKCRNCKERSRVEEGIVINNGFYCDQECVVAYATKNIGKGTAKREKALRRETRARKKELKKRNDWHADLQVLVNQYVLYRDRDKPCCTCGTTKPSIKYDAGHFYTRAARPDIRFELTNIHKQCSVRCNQHGSGMRKEYGEFIVLKYGETHSDWLATEKPPLKEQFPNWQDVEAEIVRYRKILRDVGIKPNR